MPSAIWAGLAVLAALFATGCGSRTVLVREGDPIRIGPGAKGTVYVRTGSEWRRSANSVDLPEGWYLVPPSFAEDDEEP